MMTSDNYSLNSLLTQASGRNIFSLEVTRI